MSGVIVKLWVILIYFECFFCRTTFVYSTKYLESVVYDQMQNIKRSNYFLFYLDVEIPSIEENTPKVTKNFPPPEPEYTSGSLFLKHLFALEVKRFHYARRNKKGFFCEILLPACFVCLAMLLTLILPALEMEKPLEISPWNYPTWGLNYPTETFYSNKHSEGDWPDRYLKELVSESSFGTRCVPGNTIGKFFD